jgi:tRNA threonylcarbamoyl adenosine modification protein (Sua5/YciO/YrdC/YwlC family)
LEGREDGRFRVVVSNPPYVSHAALDGLAPDVRSFEPRVALDGGVDGLAVYRRLVPQAGRALGPGGALFLELGGGQAEAVDRLAAEAGFCLTRRLRDLSGKERILLAVRPGCPRVDVDGLSSGTAAILAEALHTGALLGVPTDTVYGLAAAWRSGPGVRRLFQAKGRGDEAPVAVLFASVAALRESLPDLDPTAERVLQALLPGPYTFIVATSVPRPPRVGTPDSLGVRVPAYPPLLRLLEALGVPLAATSANFSGRPDPATLDEADPCLLAHCACGLAAPAGSGASPTGIASTVVDLRPLAGGEAARVLREGAVPAGEALGLIAALLAD